MVPVMAGLVLTHFDGSTRKHVSRRLTVSFEASDDPGHEYQHVALSANELHRHYPPEGWKFESIGHLYGPGALPLAGNMAVTLRPLPRRPTPYNILSIVGEFMHSHQQCTLNFLANQLGIFTNTIQDWLLPTGLWNPDPIPFATGKPGFGGGRVLWLKRGRNGGPWTLHPKWPRQPEEGPFWTPDSDLDNL